MSHLHEEHTNGLKDLIKFDHDLTTNNNAVNISGTIGRGKLLHKIIKDVQVNEHKEASHYLMRIINNLWVDNDDLIYTYHDNDLRELVGEILSKSDQCLTPCDMETLVVRFGFGMTDMKRLFIQRRFNQVLIEEIIISDHSKHSYRFKNYTWFKKFRSYVCRYYRIYKKEEWYPQTHRKYKHNLLLNKNNSY